MEIFMKGFRPSHNLLLLVLKNKFNFYFKVVKFSIRIKVISFYAGFVEKKFL